MTDDDPKLIMSRHNGTFSRDGTTVEVSIYRLEDSKWSLEVIDQDRNSIVWDTSSRPTMRPHAEFLRSVETEGLDGIVRNPDRLH